MNEQRSKAQQASKRAFAPPLRSRAVRATLASCLSALPLFALTLIAATPITHAHSQEPSKKQDKLLEHQSGFLDDATYSKLEPDHGNSDWLIYFRDPDVLQRSDTFLLDPVKVYLDPEAKQKQIDPADQTKLSDYFTKAIRGQLEAGRYNLVEQPGPGVMTLRFAITNVEPNGGKTNAAVSGTAAVASHAVAPGAGELVPRLKVGKVSIEGEMVDSTSGEVEMAFMTAKSGRRFFSGLKAFEKWGDIDAAFRSWAKNFRERLDKAHKA